MSKGSFVAIALLLAACGRGGDGGVGKPRVHYLLDGDGPIATRVARSPAVAAPSADPACATPRSTPEPAALIAAQENDMAAEAARENEADDRGEPDNATALNYAIFSGSVLGN